MKVLVIGGNRFFGKTLAQLLLNKNDEVTLLNRGHFDDELGDKVKRIKMDRKDLSKDHPALKDRHWDLIYDQVCYDANDAMKACEVFESKVGHYVFTSSQSVYNEGSWIKEEAFNPEEYHFSESADLKANYAEAKRQAETIFARKKVFPVTMVRFPIVLGNDDYTGRLKFHTEHIRKSQWIYFPNVEAKISFINSYDAAKVLEFVGEKKLVGPVNACPEQPISLREMIEMIERVSGKSALISSEVSKGDHSPYGIPADWFMSSEKLVQAGLTLVPIKDWLSNMAAFQLNNQSPF